MDTNRVCSLVTPVACASPARPDSRLGPRITGVLLSQQATDRRSCDGTACGVRPDSMTSRES